MISSILPTAMQSQQGGPAQLPSHPTCCCVLRRGLLGASDEVLGREEGRVMSGALAACVTARLPLLLLRLRLKKPPPCALPPPPLKSAPAA